MSLSLSICVLESYSIENSWNGLYTLVQIIGLLSDYLFIVFVNQIRHSRETFFKQS